MTIALVHLSDVHFRTDRTNPVQSRAKAIVAAAAAECQGATGCVLVFSGDLAFSGKADEYAIAEQFVNSVQHGLAERLALSRCEVIVVPGNHDCEFDSSDLVRPKVLQSSSDNDLREDSIIQSCTSHQVAFFDFASRVESTPTIAVQDRLYRRRLLTFDGASIAFELFNSAFASELRERYGYLRVATTVPAIPSGDHRDRTIAVVHHPLGWLSPSNRAFLKQFIEGNCDLVLTGHEHHTKVLRTTTDTGIDTQYLEGGVLQDHDDPNNSQFIVVLFDNDNNLQRHVRMAWSESSGLYDAVHSTAWTASVRNQSRVRKQFEPLPEFASYLDELGTVFTHPRVHSLRLSDLFQFPDLEDLGDPASVQEKRVIAGHDLIDHILKRKHIMISGDPRSGKTSLAKSLFRALLGRGSVPTKINGGDIRDPHRETLRKLVLREATAQYGEEIAKKADQLERAARALIIDNFDTSRLNLKARNALLAGALETFDIIICITGDGLGIEEFINFDASLSVFWEFQRTKILPFGAVLRDRLIRRWFALGASPEDDEQDLYDRIVQTDRTVSFLIGRDLVTPHPFHVLSLLQALEHRGRPVANVGSHGYIYQMLITDALARSTPVADWLDTQYNYLSKFAFDLYESRRVSMGTHEYAEWHSAYNVKHIVELSFENFRDALIGSGILVVKNGQVFFRERYGYCFFVARYLSQRLTHETTAAQLQVLCQNLHHSDSSEIIMFLCHLSRDEKIINTVLGAAGEVFAERRLANLHADTAFLNSIVQKMSQVTLPDGSPEANREKVLARKDANDRERRLEAEPSDRELDAESSSPAPDESGKRLAASVSAGYSTIEILGQIVRNHAGSLEGEEKKQVVVAAHSLARRMLTALFEQFQAEEVKIVDKLVERVTKLHPAWDPAKIEAAGRRLVYTFVLGATIGTIKHVSESLGTTPVSRAMQIALKETESPEQRVFDLSTKLDQCKEFPRAELEVIVKEFKKNPFVSQVLQQLVWIHLYLYPVKIGDKQAACNLVKIDHRSAALLDKRVKRVN